MCLYVGRRNKQRSLGGSERRAADTIIPSTNVPCGSSVLRLMKLIQGYQIKKKKEKNPVLFGTGSD